MILEAHGLRAELPRGWSGRVFSRSGRAATLHAASYPLSLDDGEFGDRSTALMRPGAGFVALTEYVPGDGLQPGRGLFARRGIDLPLDPVAFSSRGLAHPRPDQVGLQQFFTDSGRPFCLYVVLAGDRQRRRRALPVVDHLLRRVRIAPR